MAMNWLQQMFTPQRPGPGQMAWRDKDVGEGSGEISQGDIQEMYWKRNPAKTGNRGQMMPNAVRPNPDGSGETMQTKIQDLMPAGLEPGGISSSTPSQVDGFEELSITESLFPQGGMGDQAQVFTGSQGQGGVSMDTLYPSTNLFPAAGTGPMGDQDRGAMAAQPPGHMFTAGLTERQGVGYPTHLSAAVGPYTSGGQNQANLIGSNPDRAQMKIAEIRRQRALRDAEAARMASYTNQAPEHVSLEPFGGPGDKPDPYGGALNVADMVGQFSRSSLPSRKQPPGFWDWITGGKFN